MGGYETLGRGLEGSRREWTETSFVRVVTEEDRGVTGWFGRGRGGGLTGGSDDDPCERKTLNVT